MSYNNKIDLISDLYDANNNLYLFVPVIHYDDNEKVTDKLWLRQALILWDLVLSKKKNDNFLKFINNQDVFLMVYTNVISYENYKDKKEYLEKINNLFKEELHISEYVKEIFLRFSSINLLTDNILLGGEKEKKDINTQTQNDFNGHYLYLDQLKKINNSNDDNINDITSFNNNVIILLKNILTLINDRIKINK